MFRQQRPRRSNNYMTQMFCWCQPRQQSTFTQTPSYGASQGSSLHPPNAQTKHIGIVRTIDYKVDWEQLKRLLDLSQPEADQMTDGAQSCRSTDGLSIQPHCIGQNIPFHMAFWHPFTFHCNHNVAMNAVQTIFCSLSSRTMIHCLKL